MGRGAISAGLIMGNDSFIKRSLRVIAVLCGLAGLVLVAGFTGCLTAYIIGILIGADK